MSRQLVHTSRATLSQATQGKNAPARRLERRKEIAARCVSMVSRSDVNLVLLRVFSPRLQPTSVAEILLPTGYEASSRAIWRRRGRSSRRGACRATGVASHRRHCCCRRHSRCCSIASSSSALGSREAREEHGFECEREIEPKVRSPKLLSPASSLLKYKRKEKSDQPQSRSHLKKNRRRPPFQELRERGRRIKRDAALIRLSLAALSFLASFSPSAT